MIWNVVGREIGKIEEIVRLFLALDLGGLLVLEVLGYLVFEFEVLLGSIEVFVGNLMGFLLKCVDLLLEVDGVLRGPYLKSRVVPLFLRGACLPVMLVLVLCLFGRLLDLGLILSLLVLRGSGFKVPEIVFVVFLLVLGLLVVEAEVHVQLN